MTVTGQLKVAITESGLTHYRLAKDTGLDTRAIDRFMDGTSLRGTSIDALAEYFGLELQPKKAKRKPKAK